MARDLFNRYIWLVDTIRRYGRITRAEIDRLWVKSPFSAGDPLPRRTFLNYRQAAEELFNIEIKCDSSTFEYYIEDNGREDVRQWLLNTAATHELLSNSTDVAAKILVEDVPSARDHLGPVIDALRQCKRLRFSYHPYSRTLPTTGIVLEPYFVKLFRQRWYMVGRHVEQNRIKTYALDRITRLNILTDTFTPPADFDPKDYFRDAYGIVVSAGAIRDVALRVEARQAKYFRALPLHHTQEEFLHDEYSIFRYRLKISDDFIEELLKYGSRITVLEPRELRLRMAAELSEALKAYHD